MAAASALGGFSGPKADTLGYAVRKKQKDVLAGLKQEFITSAGERGVARSVIEQVFQAFEPFANYGFNKAHATCYGMIAYQTAYLKANYTVEYMTSVLNAFRNKEDKVASAIAECRRLGIEILPPDVERSQLDFEPEGARSASAFLRSRTLVLVRWSQSSTRAQRAVALAACKTSVSGSICDSRTSASLRRSRRLVRCRSLATQHNSSLR